LVWKSRVFPAMGHEYQIREDNNDEVSDGDEYEMEQGRPAQYE